MKKYNVKTLAEIAVLCIFCDNIQVWSMNSSDVINPSPKDNSPISINEEKINKKLFGDMDLEIKDSEKILLNSMRNEKRIYMLNSNPLDWKDKNGDRISLGGGNRIHNKLSFRSLRKISSKKIDKNKENKLELLFFNKKGHLSLCCCINFFNGNMENPGFRKKRKTKRIRGRLSSECSEYAESSQKDESNDNNNCVSRPVINNNIIIPNVNPNLNYENNNDKKFTNEEPNSVNNPPIILNNISSNPYN